MLVLKSTEEDSGLRENGIWQGAKLLKVNNHDVCDMLDYRFYSADDHLLLFFEGTDGQMVELELDRDDLLELDFEFEPDKPKGCGNKCIFCFIHQLPKGLRRSLYFKDEDYRLSFQYGNYITLTNLSDNDFARIREQRLSPLYVSVHTTDDALRRKMLGNDRIPSLLPQMRRLIDSGVELHTQIVLCPGWNDGEHLLRTLDDLARLYSGVRSIAVVPVGLTKHRSNLPVLDSVTPDIASAVIDDLIRFGDDRATEFNNRFVYPADEFFMLAGKEIPPASFYDGFPQIENGVGMVRQLMDTEPVEKVKLDRSLRLSVVTGRLMFDLLNKILDEKWDGVENLKYDIIAVDNNLLGESITVSGLLCGQDILDAAERFGSVGDCLIVPPDCLNDDGLFLDDLTLSDLSDRLRCPVIQADYFPADTLNTIQKELAN